MLLFPAPGRAEMLEVEKGGSGHFWTHAPDLKE